MLRAVEKAEHYWRQHGFYTGYPEESMETKKHVLEIVRAAKLVQHLVVSAWCPLRVDVGHRNLHVCVCNEPIEPDLQAEGFCYAVYLSHPRSCSDLFDETVMFTGDSSQQLKVRTLLSFIYHKVPSECRHPC